MCNLLNSFWLSQWSRYIVRGNTNPGYPSLFQGDSPLIWIHRLRESLSKNKNSFWFSLFQVYGRSITNALLLKLVFLLSCCLCSYVFSITVSSKAAFKSCIYLLISYLLRSVVDAHTRLYLARVTIRVESGLTGILFYRLLSSYKLEKTNNEIDDKLSDNFHEIQSKIRLEIEDDEGVKSRNIKSFQNIFKRSNSSMQDYEDKSFTYKKSFKYLLSDPDVFSMLVGDISAVQLFLNSFIDCLLLPVNIFLTWILLSKQVGFITALPGIITFSIFLISSFVFQILGTIYKAPFMECRDQRLSVCHEILGLLRLIRIMGIEDLAFDRIMKSRSIETKYNRKRLVRTQFGSFLEYHTQRATQLIVFIIFYIFNGTSLNLSSALASIHILHSLSSPLRGIPVTFIEGLISLLRIKTFLSSHLDNDCEYLEEDDDTSTNCEFIGIIDFNSEKSDSNIKRFNSTHRSLSNTNNTSTLKIDSFIHESHRIIKSHLSSENLLPLFGRCVIITGSSGCGKTSIISSILDCKDNELCYAYSCQDSWIPQGTVRSAILFGKPWNEDLYYLVTDICQLQHDFQTWKDGDLRIIDEGGLSLSGGQRTRVTLARSLYHQSDASLYLFDDIFLNLDPNVGIKIFYRLFGNNGFLNNPYSKVILTIDLTSLLYFINNQIDKNWTLIHIIHLNNKNIFFSGSLNEYLNLINRLDLDDQNNDDFSVENNSTNVNVSNKNNDNLNDDKLIKEDLVNDSFYSPINTKHLSTNSESYSSLFKSPISEKELNNEELEIIHRINTQISTLQSKNISIESLQSIIGTTPTSSGTGTSSSTLNLSISFASGKTVFKSAPLSGDLITETEINLGKKSSFQIYKWYFTMVGKVCCIILFLSCIIKSLLDRYSDTFISYNDSKNNPNFIFIYTLIVILEGLFCAILFIGEAVGGTNASDMAHNSLVKKMLFSPFWIYDSTPVSYLMNRMSTDMLILDECPLKRIASVIVPVIDFLIQISILSYAVPLSFPIALLVTIITYKIVCQRYISTYIRAQKVALSVLSPMYSLFSQLINGIAVIHAFNAQRHLLNQFLVQIEHLQRIRLLQHIASQWAAIRLQIYTLPLILFILLIPVESNWRHLALLYSLLISDTTSVITYKFASMERDMCSSERVFQLISKGSKEFKENQNINDNQKNDNKNINRSKTNTIYHLIPSGILNDKFRRTGIKIIDLEVGYSDIKGMSYDNVLEGINMNIDPYEHIGVVGRTGSGKSTLILALLGLVEYRKGQILLDEIPITSLTINERRKIIGVLPQTPLVFKDWTVRDFLDPYNEFTNEEIYNGLRECLLDSTFKEIQKDLSVNVNSLSASQLRYLSIAKLVVSSHQYKMILIDEPPPNTKGDQGYQQNINKILATHFKHCNVFIVAHHVESIRDCNNIWILAQRRLVKTIHPSSVPTQYELAQILTNYE